MTDEELRALVENAMSDLDTVGMHWLPTYYSKHVLSVVSERWPGRTITSSRPAPYDESVLFDEDRAEISRNELPSIAAAREAERRRRDT